MTTEATQSVTTETNQSSEQQAVTQPEVNPQTQTNQNTESKTDNQNEQSEQNPTVPDKYEFSVPEGFEALNERAVELFSPVAKELGLTQEQAQKLVDIHAQTIKEQQDQATAQTEKWVSEVKADKEIGGADLNKNLELGKKALDTFGTPELVQFLEESGLGNHPEIIKFCVKAGKAFSEDSFVNAETKQTEKTAAEVLYPNHRK